MLTILMYIIPLKPHDYMQAAIVPRALAPHQFGDWLITRQPYNAPAFGRTEATFLCHLENDGLVGTWDTVMEDSIGELKKHLPIWMRAEGSVLVTGLGLGCVVRGLLANPAVSHIDVVEIDPDIHAIVGEEFCKNPRVALHLGDALTHKFQESTTWDFAWHDIWTPQNRDLQIKHAKLFRRFQRRVRVAQGAWAFPRCMKRLYEAKMGEMLK